MDTKQALTKAKLKLVLSQPFFASLALGMEYVENNDIETARTDGKSIEYNPKYIDTLHQEFCMTLVAHEVLHPALLHHTRGIGKDHKLWNAAADYAVNLLLRDAGFKIPTDWLIDERFRGMNAEQIYSILDKEKKNGAPQPQDCGPGEVIAPKGDVKQAEAEAKQTLVQATEIAKQAGKPIPSILKEQIGELLEPKIDWKEQFSRYLAERAKNDYSWSKPSPRYMPMGIYLPILENLEIGKCVFSIDTSISMDKEVLIKVVSELKEASTLFRFPVTVIHCDTEVRHVEEMEEDSDIEPVGRGCTDFRPPFAYVDEEGLDIKVLVYLTDGYCDYFPTFEPDYPVLWVIYNNKRFNPPFGEVIYVD